MQQTNPKAEQRGKKSVLAAGLGAAFVAAGITFVMMSGSPAPSPSTTPAQVTAPVQTAMQAPIAPVQAAPPVQTAPPVQAAPPLQAPPVTQADPPQANGCKRAPLVEYAFVQNGGSGVIRFREGDYVSPWITLTGEQQPIVFPTPRHDTIFKESILIEGHATNLVLGGDGDHFEVPTVDGSYSYTMSWEPGRCEPR